LDSAYAIAASEPMDALEVSDGIARLVATSLLATDLGGNIVRYRLLDTTRAFAKQKLAESGEEPAIARRHAIHCLGLLEHAESDWENKTQDEWLKVHGGWIDDLRPALDWAFSPDGDPAVGIALTTTSAPLWFVLSLGDEFCERAEHALQHLAASSLVDSELELKLNLWLGAAIFNARGIIPRLSEVSNRALEIAAHHDLPIYQIRQLWKLSGERCVSDDYRATLALAERLASTVAARPRRVTMPNRRSIPGNFRPRAPMSVSINTTTGSPRVPISRASSGSRVSRIAPPKSPSNASPTP
jgi:hypothetical protein